MNIDLKKTDSMGLSICIEPYLSVFPIFFKEVRLLENTGDRDKSDVLQVPIKHLVKSLLKCHLG